MTRTFGVHHGGTEPRRKLVLEDLTQEIIGAAIDAALEIFTETGIASDLKFVRRGAARSGGDR